MDATLPDHIRAHERSNQHRDEDDADVGQTALCPECGLDTVLGAGSGFPITDDFLRQMQGYWCAESAAGDDADDE